MKFYLVLITYNLNVGVNDDINVLVAKGVTPIGPSDYVPIIKSTVTYIVLVVLVNSDDEVLMMQEAKSTCAGQWYLPAGRVEPGEDLHVG